MFSIAHFLHDLLLFVTLLLSPPVASHLWHLLNILQCEAQKSAEEKNNNPTLTLVTGCLVCQLTHHNPLVAHVTSLAQAKTSNYPVFFFVHGVLSDPLTLPLNQTSQLALFVQHRKLPLWILWTARLLGRRLDERLNFQQWPELSRNSGSWAADITRLNVFVVLCAWCWKISRAQKAAEGLKGAQRQRASSVLAHTWGRTRTKNTDMFMKN